MRASYAVIAVLQLVGTAFADKPQNDLHPKFVEITCEEYGMFSKGYSWSLAVNGTGTATLTVYRGRGDSVHRFVMRDQLPKLASETAAQKFFELPSEIGRTVSDGSVRKMTIKTRDREKTVTIRYVDGPVDATTERALKMWNAIRNCFDDKDAFDSRPYDAALLKPSLSKRP
jgi:hypothetical protein